VRLQWKLTLAFAAVALGPIAVLAGVARVVVANQYRAQFRATLEQAEGDVEREYQRMGDEVADAVQRMAKPDDPTLGPLLVALARGALDEDRRDELEERAKTAMRALGFDVLDILDERGEILAAPHLSGRVGDQDPAALAFARRSAGHAQLVEDRHMVGGDAKPCLAVEAAREVEGKFAEGQRARVTLIGGRVLGDEFVGRLHRGARLVSADGKLVYGPPAPAPSNDGPQTIVEFKRGDGSVAARVELAIGDAELRRTLELISLLAGGLAAGGVVLALLLGAMVARRWSVPLGELADGARSVARGDLAVTVPIHGRDEIGQLARAFNAMIRDLLTAREELVRAERVAAWKEIAQRIAHEIKNPLTPIQMAIETLQRAHAKGAEPFDRLFDESAKTILDEVARLKNIVGEFSAFARMPAPQLAPVALNEVVEATLAIYLSDGPQQPIERMLGASLPPAMADRDQLTQVLINLLENARDAAGADGKVVVATRVAAGRVELEVRDSGPGLTDEARARLFTPYFTTKPKGTGLGLAIVHRIVSDHGGEIRVDSPPGRGATFTVSLPARDGVR
jgi:signal transduction histidine kinase